MPDHLQDKGIKRLLMQRKYFLRFLKKYINVFMVNSLNETDLQLIDKSFIDPDFRARESDIVYRIKNDEQDLIFYIILEMQVKVDYSMPIRLLFYITEMLRRIFIDTDKSIRERKDFKMPAVVPMVLYVGENRWTAARSYREYTYQGEMFGNSIIDFNYEILDLNAVQKEILESGDNPVDAILLANKLGLSNQPELVLTAIGKMLPRIPAEQWPDIMDYIIDVFLKRIKNVNKDLVSQLRDAFEKGDVNSVEVVLDAFEQALIEKEEKTLSEGIQKGKKEAAYETARKMKRANLQKELILEVTGLSEVEFDLVE